MADPSPPEDAETKTIIDKLANFVARNGPEFEAMTKKKQQHNPKFSFLFGGENHQYYLWKVSVEKGRPGPGKSTMADAPPPGAGSTLQLVQKLHVTKLKEKTDAIANVDPLEAEFQNVVNPVMMSCTKESIASGKGWILSHSKSEEDCGKMAHYIMRRTVDLPEIEFSHKLHVIYLINDIVHHCVRKEVSDLKQALETVIIQIFYNVFSSHVENSEQLMKVLSIWETQKYFSNEKLTAIKEILKLSSKDLPQAPPTSTPEPLIGEDKTTPPPPPPWVKTFNSPLPPWQQTPPRFPSGPPPPPPPGAPPMPNVPPPPWVGQPPPWTHPQTHPPSQPTPLFSDETAPPPNDGKPFTKSIDYNHKSSEAPPPMEIGPHPPPPPSMQVFDYNHRSMAPPNWDLPPRPPFLPFPPHMGGRGGPFPFPPDLHLRPPFSPGPLPPEMPPPIPYYDLPAGIMVTVVPLHEDTYRPIDPRCMFLPPPQPPSERLLSAVEEFYSPPTEDKPRNEEGWESKALLEFYEAKRRAKEEFMRRSLAPPPFHPPGPPMRQPRQRKRSRSFSPKRRRRRSFSRSPSHSPRSSRRRSSRSPSSKSRSSSSSRSRSRSRSPRRISRHRSRSFSPSTPTLEEYAKKNIIPSTIGQSSSDNRKINEENVGHQMLRKMGWEGAGLGSKGQGIQAPIKGGEVRGKINQFAGVGVDTNDPFEQFRRNKSYTFNRRPPSGPS